MTESLFYLLSEKDSYNIIGCMEYDKLDIISRSKVLPFSIDFKKLTYLKFPQSYDAAELLLVNDPILRHINPWKVIYITILTKGEYGCKHFHHKLRHYLGAPSTAPYEARNYIKGKDLILMLSSGDPERLYDNPVTGLDETNIRLLNEKLRIPKTMISWESFKYSFDGSVENALSTYSCFPNAEEIVEYFSQRNMLYLSDSITFRGQFRERLKRNRPKEISFLRYLLTNHPKIIEAHFDYHLLADCVKCEHMEFVKMLLKFEFDFDCCVSQRPDDLALARSFEYYEDFINAIIDNDMILSPEIGKLIRDVMRRDCSDIDFEKLIDMSINVMN